MCLVCKTGYILSNNDTQCIEKPKCSDEINSIINGLYCQCDNNKYIKLNVPNDTAECVDGCTSSEF